jgi:large subunit ribosomal protein L29
MKIDKVREIDSDDLKRQLSESEEQMFRLRFQLKMGQTEGVKKLRELRRDRARMLTVLRQRELETANAGNRGK